jgi:hypothetical protein
VHTDITALRNIRSPRANLEALYGGGPVGSPYLYDHADPAKLLLGVGGRDVPRNQQGVALISEPRNDVHAFMTGLQVAFIHAHNRLVDRLRADGVPESELFDDARRALNWHYQWVILNDFLPNLVGEAMTTTVLRDGLRFYRLAGEPFIPVEFADAAYRYGHSQIKGDYQLRRGGPRFPVFPDLAGFRPLASEHVIDWTLLFDVPGHPSAQRAKPIDGQLPASLIRLPESITGVVEVSAYRSLAARDLQRGMGTGLPSGEAVAHAVGARQLTREELALGDWQDETPLWLLSSARPRFTVGATTSARSAAASSLRSLSASFAMIPSLISQTIRPGGRRCHPTSRAALRSATSSSQPVKSRPIASLRVRTRQAG